VDVRFDRIDTPEQIVARVEKALEHVPPERLSLNPDCGFAPGKNHDTPLEEAYAKLKGLAEAARLLRQRIG
jgi:5-methyltetrahydropteroyltriglutamate--homocysteine methyltransferase